MHVVPVGLRFGVAPFLWRSEDRAPADVLLLPLLRVRGDAFTFRRKTARVILPALNAVSFSLADELIRRSQRLPSARKRPEFNNGLDSSGRKVKTADGLNVASSSQASGLEAGRAESKAETSNGLNKVGAREGEFGRRV